MPTRFFSGRESWVFRAQFLDELCGHHPDLIAGALVSDERVRYLVYSPLRETTAGPFGIRGASGSHALALTDSRVIVSRDPHTPGSARTVRVLRYEDILFVELGEALTLGWLVFHFVTPEGVASETMVFQSTGIDLFRTAVRILRGRDRPTDASPAAAREPDANFAQAPPYLRSQLLPVLLNDEQPRLVVQSVQRWRTASGRRPACTIPERLSVVTERSLVIVESERPHRPGALVFGVNVTCIDRPVVREVTIASARGDVDVAEVAVDLGASTAPCRLRYLLDPVGADALKHALMG